MRLLKLFFIAALIVGLGIFCYDRLPKKYRYEIDDWYARLGEPTFIESPDSFTNRPQDDLIREYKNRGHKLKCYGNLQHEERITAQNDFLCLAHINTAYDGIPARLVTFFFTKGELSEVRLEFPSSSFKKLMSYLSRKLENRRRLDRIPGNNFGTDNMGGKLMVWEVPTGVLVTSDSEVPGDITVLIWLSKKSLAR
ncbi:hypothetical protein [Quatrionicoccus australiensis]|uniref:hypothetical protein n=1 Tax=Quatrionicoccus australiensis TaxID=138118 RepID=UPI001CFB0AAB|nr:hypothetical protein [Quatrionicoccus australiensis]MCB4361383.1 hypothetical protein [Quatrionicoccus australiensis]